MGGKQSPEWWREYRRRRAAELGKYNKQRRQDPKVKAQRHASEQRRRARIRVEQQQQPLPMLMPHLQHGSAISFWEDELRLDLEQEGHLAALEGRDPIEAVAIYRTRELMWRALTVSLP